MKKTSIAVLILWTAVHTGINAENTADRALHLIPSPKTITWISDSTIFPQDTIPQIRIIHSPDSPAFSPESYTINITPQKIIIDAHGKQGVVWATQTLRQLRLSDGGYPHVSITDYPEFPIRGFLYDDGRNFAGIERIKKYLDMMSAYKLNVFQWHLTDKPAWRIESKVFPRLNDGKFQRPGRDQGKYYSYDEIRDIISYANLRGITVIPEIDMPGHSDFFQTTFGVPMDSDEGKKILELCIKEFCKEIPADICPYIHIGSDEVHIADPKGFMKWTQDLVRRQGRKTLAWDPGLPTDSLTIRQFWREPGLNVSSYPENAPFVDSSMGYLNNYDPLLLPAKIFFHALGGTGKSDSNCLGGIICLWNDVRVEDKDLTALHNGLAGGIMSFSERAWYGNRHYDINPVRHGTIIPEPTDYWMLQYENLQQNIADHKKRFFTEDLSYWEPIHANEWTIEVDTDSIYRIFTAYGDVLDLDALCRAHGIPDSIKLTCYLRRTIDSPSDTTRYFKIGFEAPARSNRNSDGIAQQGEWPNYGTIKVNGIPVEPPVWEEPGAYRYHYHTWARLEEELPYTNEQLYWMRPPHPIKLQQGKNVVQMSVKRHFTGQHFQVSFVEASSPKPICRDNK